MVEQKPSKLMTRVRFPSPAPVSELVSLLETACVLPARSDRDRLALLADFPDLIIIPDALRPWGVKGELDAEQSDAGAPHAAHPHQ